MKKMFLLSMLTSIAMICSCQKQDSAAEQELAQRKTELDARENALDEKVNALDEKVNALDEKLKALFEKEQATLNAVTTATGVQGQTPDPAQVTAERDRTIQQLRALILDRSKVTAGDPAKQERPAPRQLGPEDLQRQWQQNLDKAKMSGKAVFHAPEATSPTPSPAIETTSPTQSPAPQ
jgi:peptidoglycan hydrolase CwlO-like protein